MKSRAAFDPSKPFVFPPFAKPVKSLGCGVLSILTLFLVGIFIVVICSRGSLVSTAPEPTAPSATALAPATSVPSASPHETSKVVSPSANPPRETGSGMLLKQVSSFPVTVVMSRQVNIVTARGGFGLDPGDELRVIGKTPAGEYIVSHQSENSTVNAKLIEDMKLK